MPGNQSSVPIWLQNPPVLEPPSDVPVWLQNPPVDPPTELTEEIEPTPYEYTEEDQERILEIQRLADTLTPPAPALATAVAPPTQVQQLLDSKRDAAIKTAKLGFFGPGGDGKPVDPIDQDNQEYYAEFVGPPSPSPTKGGGPYFSAGQLNAEPSEITGADVAEAQIYLELSDLAREHGVEAARRRIFASGGIDPTFRVLVDGFFGTTPSAATQFGTTYAEKIGFGLAGALAGYIVPGMIVGKAGLASKTALKLTKTGAPGLVADLGARAVGSGATFGLRGMAEIAARITNNEEVTVKEAAQHITHMTLFGGGLGVAGGIAQPALKIPAHFMIGYLASYLEGASTEEALITGLLFMGLGAMNTRAVKWEVRNAALKHVITQTEKDLVAAGVPKTAMPSIRAKLHDIWSRKVNADLKDLIKYQEEVTAFIKDIKATRPRELFQPGVIGKARPGLAEGIKTIPERAGQTPVDAFKEQAVQESTAGRNAAVAEWGRRIREIKDIQKEVRVSLAKAQSSEDAAGAEEARLDLIELQKLRDEAAQQVTELQRGIAEMPGKKKAVAGKGVTEEVTPIAEEPGELTMQSKASEVATLFTEGRAPADKSFEDLNAQVAVLEKENAGIEKKRDRASRDKVLENLAEVHALKTKIRDSYDAVDAAYTTATGGLETGILAIGDEIGVPELAQASYFDAVFDALQEPAKGKYDDMTVDEVARRIAQEYKAEVEAPETLPAKAVEEPPGLKIEEPLTGADITPKPKLPPSEAVLELPEPVQVEVRDIKVREDLFQPRNKIDPNMVKRIANKFDIDLYDPPLLWKDPDTGDLVMVSGHTRLAGLKAGNIGRAPFRILPEGTTVEEARAKAEGGNLQRVEQNDWENSRVVRRRLEAGASKAEIQRDLPGLGSPAKVANLERLSYLKQKGPFNENWENPGGFPKVVQFGYFIGGQRKVNPWLTDRHEQDIFDWLYHAGAVHHKDSAVPQEVIMNALDLINAGGGDPPTRLTLAKEFKTGRAARPDMEEGVAELKELRKDTERLMAALEIASTPEAKNTIRTELALIADKIYQVEKNLTTIEETQTGLFEGMIAPPDNINMFTGDPERVKSPEELDRLVAAKEARDQYEREQEFIKEQAAAGKLTRTNATVARARARSKYTKALEAAGQKKSLFEEEAGEPEPEQGALFETTTATTARGEGQKAKEPVGKVPRRVMSIGRIKRNLARDIGIPIRGKATHRPTKYAGWYQTHGRMIRVFNWGNLPTHFHEAGHHMERVIWGTGKNLDVIGRPHFSKFRKELADLDYDQGASGRRTSEGFAEYIRILISEIADAATIAPTFHPYFMNEILPAQPKMKKAILRAKRDYKTYRDQGSEARILSQIDFVKSIREKAVDLMESGIARSAKVMVNAVRAALWDDILPIRQAMLEAGVTPEDLRPSKNPELLARVLKMKSPGMARMMVVEGTFDFAGNKTGMSLAEALEPVRKDIRKFLVYAYARKALDLVNVADRRAELGLEDKGGIDPGISLDDAKHVFDKYDSPVWREASDNLTQWSQRGVLQYLVDSGVLDQGGKETMEAIHWVYLPLMRSFDTESVVSGFGRGKGYVDQGSPIKPLRGSARPIIDPLESLIRQLEAVISMANKTRVVRAIVELEKDVPGLGGMLAEVPAPLKVTKIKPDRIVDWLEKQGFEVDERAFSEIERLLTVFGTGGKIRPRDDIVSVFINGKRRYFQFTNEDKSLLRVMEGMDAYVGGPLFQLLAFPTRMVRLGATGLNPAFSFVRNLFRDIMMFSVTSRHTTFGPFSALMGTAKVVAHELGIKESEAYLKFKRGGGQHVTFIGQDRTGIKNLEKRIIKGRAYYYATNPLDALASILQITEIGTRTAEMEAAYKKGEELYGVATEDANLYGFDAAQEGTLNFTRMGYISRILNQAIPFWSATLGGPAKIFRTFKANPAEASMRYLIWIGSLSAATYMLNHDRKDHKERTAYEKATYWWYYLDDDETGNARAVIRLSKPFELGAISTAVEAYMDNVREEDPELFGHMIDEIKRQTLPASGEGIGGTLEDFASRIALLSPAIDVWRNKDFAGRPIVPQRLEGGVKELEYDEDMAKVYRYLGRKLGVSPIQMKHMVDSYSGGLTSRVERVIDNAVKLMEDGGEGLARSDIPVIGTIFSRSIGKPGRSIERFYGELEELSANDKSGLLTRIETGRLKTLRRMAKVMAKKWTRLRKSTTREEVEKIYREMVGVMGAAFGRNNGQ